MALSTARKLVKKAIVGCIAEVAYGDGTAVDVANYFEAYLEPNAVEYDIAELPRPFTNTSLSPFASIPGEGSAKVSLKVPIKGSGAAGTAPRFGPLLKACLMSETVTPATSVVYKPASSTPASASIWIFEDLTKHVLKGVVGNVKLVLPAGKLAMLEFELMSLYTEPAAAAFPSPSFDSVVPKAYLNTVNTLDSLAFPFGTFNIDLGNVVAARPDPNGARGLAGFIVSDRNPRGSFDPEEQAIGDYNWMSKITSVSETALSLIVGSTAGNICTITAPKVQPVKRARINRDGVSAEGIDLKLNRNAGDDEVSIAFT